jgi:hypothetical protein
MGPKNAFSSWLWVRPLQTSLICVLASPKKQVAFRLMLVKGSKSMKKFNNPSITSQQKYPNTGLPKTRYLGYFG